MKKQLLLVAAISVTGLSAQELVPGQSPSAAKPKFEVASVKECKAGDRPPPSITSPGRLSLGCRNLKMVILTAYEVFASGKVDPLNPSLPLTPMEGDPAWINSASYSFDAKSDIPQSGAMMQGPMMQALLEERFHMRTHREIHGVVLNIRDVTERRRLETELLHAQKLEAIGMLAAGGAHEINTPIQYVGDNIHFLHDAFGSLLRLVRSAAA